jgi:hypothetical protein
LQPPAYTPSLRTDRFFGNHGYVDRRECYQAEGTRSTPAAIADVPANTQAERPRWPMLWDRRTLSAIRRVWLAPPASRQRPAPGNTRQRSSITRLPRVCANTLRCRANRSLEPIRGGRRPQALRPFPPFLGMPNLALASNALRLEGISDTRTSQERATARIRESWLRLRGAMSAA